MKYTYLFLILLFCSCIKPENEDIKSTFINDFYLEKDYDIDVLSRFMTKEFNKEFDNLTDKQSKINKEYLKAIIDKTRKALSNTNYDFKVKAKEDFDYNFIKQNKINYNGSGKIFYLVSKGDIMISFFIIENKKIYSFCPDIYQTKKNNIEPYFFFKQN